MPAAAAPATVVRGLPTTRTRADPLHVPAGPMLWPMTLYSPTPYLAYLSTGTVFCQEIPDVGSSRTVQRKPANSIWTRRWVMPSADCMVTGTAVCSFTSMASSASLLDRPLTSTPLMVAEQLPLTSALASNASAGNVVSSRATVAAQRR